MSAEKKIIKELDMVLYALRRAEQNIIGMDVGDKMQTVEKLVALEDAVKDIQTGIVIPPVEITKDTKVSELLDDGLLSIRACNVLMRSGCNTISDICGHTDEEIKNMRNMGAKAYKEVLEFIASNGFEIKRDNG